MVVRPDPVSVIIPTIYANPLLLNKAKQGVYPTGARLIVADDPDASFAQNCNTGARYAPGEILVFLNDDTEPEYGWLDPLVDAFEDPHVGIAGARLTYPDGRLQHAGVALRDRGGLEAYNILEDLPSRDVEAVTGACLAIRSELFWDLGGFDEGFVNGYEDVDLCLRARAAGWRIRYVAESTVIHHESQSGARRWANVRENIVRLQERYGNHQRV